MDLDPRLPRRPALLSLVGPLVVVLSFLSITIVTQHAAQTIDHLALNLQIGAIPSVDHLAAARGELRRLTIGVRDLLRAGAARRSPDRDGVTNAERQLDSEMEAYVDLPTYSGERIQQQLVAKDLGVFQGVTHALLARVDAGDIAEARALVETEFMPASNLTDLGIEKLLRLNANEAVRVAREIQRTRQKGTHLSYLLHGLAGLLALLVLWAVARANRSYAQLVESRARLEAERKQLAERRAEELDMFAARVAHDLRNPISAIAMNVALADRQAEQPSQVRTTLKRADRAIERTKQIIEGLLWFARSVSEVALGASTDLGEALDGVLADLGPEVERAKADLSTEPFDSIQVACAAGPLMSVLGNLVGNALKYIVGSPIEARHVRVRARHADNDAFVRIEVEDTGPGIPLEIQKRIFDPYVRGAETGLPGLGLGLATVTRIVEACGGTVGVRSAVGSGSCFWIELPRTHAQDPRLAIFSRGVEQ